MRWRALGMVIAVLTAAVAGFADHSSDAAVTRSPRVGLGIVVPAYWYPGTPSWKNLASMHNPPRWPGGKSPRTVSEAVFNPCAPDGKTCSPGNAPNPAARKDMRAAAKNGITFYGYIWTGGGQVSLAAVKAKVREYASWYGLHDIFLDGASTECGKEVSYYRPLDIYVHSHGGKTILNPGTQPPVCYLKAADQIDVFEGTGANFTGYRPAGWMTRYPADRFIAIVHTTRNSAGMAKAVADAAQHDHVGNVYVTNLRMPNPYLKLPVYWSQEVTTVSKTAVR